MNDTQDRPRLNAQLARELHEHHPVRHYVRLGSFVAIYAACASTVWWCSAIVASQPAWWLLMLPLYLAAAGALHGISLFTHEAVHNTLSSNPVWNRVLGAACAIPVLQNCSAYRVLHLRHHHHLGEGGDPDHYANYSRWSWMVSVLNWLRLLVGYPVYIVAIPILGFKHGTSRDRVGILAEFAATLALVVAVVLAPLPTGLLWHGWVVPMIFINFMVNVRGMSQHTLLPEATDEVRGTRSILTGPVVSFFMCHENLHLEHHLYPGVPWYHLPKVHQALRPQLAAMGAPYIGSYSAFVLKFMRNSVNRGHEVVRDGDRTAVGDEGRNS
ncbi:fatty acid desaturase [Verrucomicrobium sp. BvORR106]|uniref:fatty acid desaturase family protein n=1 Tax=Verrucomicrobium sp. BvORR106 TaxID=1403819 RepID=UPI000AC09CEC|nr:fatty acid desaturase [Verrucomicrobium sp. BvORR106]